MRLLSLMLAAALLAACAREGTVPKSAAEAARKQAELASTPEQKRLWQAVAESGAPPEIAAAHSGKDSVQQRVPALVSDKPIEATPLPLPDAVKSAVIIHDAPELAEPFSGEGEVRAVGEQLLVLDIGQKQPLRVQAKLGGEPLRAERGQKAQVLLRRGDLLARGDVLAIRLPQDDLAYALIGGKSPVRVEIGLYSLTASQTGVAKENSMDVRIVVGGQARTLRQGEEIAFERSALTVKVLASVAVEEEAANVLPEPYRLEVIAWRTR